MSILENSCVVNLALFCTSKVSCVVNLLLCPLMHKVPIQARLQGKSCPWMLKQSQLSSVYLQASSGLEGTERSQQASIACSDTGLHTPNLR